MKAYWWTNVVRLQGPDVPFQRLAQSITWRTMLQAMWRSVRHSPKPVGRLTPAFYVPALHSCI